MEEIEQTYSVAAGFLDWIFTISKQQTTIKRNENLDTFILKNDIERDIDARDETIYFYFENSKKKCERLGLFRLPENEHMYEYELEISVSKNLKQWKVLYLIFLIKSPQLRENLEKIESTFNKNQNKSENLSIPQDKNEKKESPSVQNKSKILEKK